MQDHHARPVLASVLVDERQRGARRLLAEDRLDGVEHHNYPELRKPEAERGEKHSHETITVVGPATKWELENHGNYQTYAHPDSWWGHCNGWASYATAEALGAPKRDIRVKNVDGKVIECESSNEEGCILVRMGDIEALMSEVYFSDTATFAGRRCKESPDDMERDEYGRPRLELHGEAALAAKNLGVRHTWVSLTHEGDNAGAMVVLEG